MLADKTPKARTRRTGTRAEIDDGAMQTRMPPKKVWASRPGLFVPGGLADI
jgi:hypothetical protein